jgi:hypothetical protein
MRYANSSERFARASSLRERGIPVDEDELSSMEAIAGGMVIWQTGTAPESSTWELESGGTAFIVRLMIENRSDQPLALVRAVMEPPWHEPHGVRLLKDPGPKRTRPSLYEFPGRRLCPMEREVVFNHRIGRNRPLMPRESFDGFLLAVGEMPMPPEYCDRARIEINVTLIDQHNMVCEELFNLMACRAPKRSPKERPSARVHAAA